jgi:hypothetical protein
MGNGRQFRTFFLQSTRIGILWINLLYSTRVL